MEVLRHAIGKSTFMEGLSIPRQLETWIDAPAAGCRRDVILHFEGRSVAATLRRLANERGHVQVKYENKTGEPFRHWMESVFVASKSGAVGEYLELHKLGEDHFEVRAFPKSRKAEEHLEVREWILHRVDSDVFERHTQMQEIPAIVQSVCVGADSGQEYYNRQLSRFFGEWLWQSERRVIPELPLKADFIKDEVIVEVEFGNARTYYQDYVKFMLAHNRGTAEVGVLIVPTEELARGLCQAGRRRAEAKGRHTYSGMIHIEKVRRELKYLDFMLSGPIAIAGIGTRGSRI